MGKDQQIPSLNVRATISHGVVKIMQAAGLLILSGLAIRLALSAINSLLWPQIIAGGRVDSESVFFTSAFFLLVALLISVFVWAGRLIYQRINSKPNLHRQNILAGSVSFASVGLALVHLFCVAGLAQIDITQAGFSKESLGFTYSFFRMGVLISMTFATLGAGGWIASKIERGFMRAPYAQSQKLVVSLGLGILFYAILGCVIGFVGLLNAPVALAASLPAILASGIWLRAASNATYEASTETSQAKLNSYSLLKIFLWVLVSMLLSIIVLTKGLYPGALDTDIWEHYFHYYEHVIQTGHIKPNEVWYQFYLSKGAGLFFIFMVMSDFFAPQLVSVIILLLVSIIIFDVTKVVTGDVAWSAAALIVFYAYLLHDYDSGAFFKHHFVFLGLLSFVAWCIYNLFSATLISKSNVAVVTMMACCFYAGFYLPAVSVILCGMLVITILINKSKKNLQIQIQRNITKALLFIIAGGVISIGVNWAATGLGEIVPVKLFWMFADQERFLRLFGSNGLDYFMLNDSKVIFSEQRNWNGRWLAAVLHYPFFNFLLSIEILALGALLILQSYLSPHVLSASFKNLFLVLVALMIPSVLFAQYVQIPSTIRLFIFAGFFVVIACVCSLQAGISVFIPAGSQLTISSVFMVLISVCAIIKAVPTVIVHRAGLSEFYSTHGSLRTTLGAAESLTKHGSKVGIDFISRVRAIIGPQQVILALGYDPGYYYMLPKPGIKSEPSYAFGPGWDQMGHLGATKLRAELASQGISYFVLGLDTHLFSKVAFSPLFSSIGVMKNLKVVLSDQDRYLLTWKDPASTDSVPTEFLEVLEFKRSGALFFPFSEKFCRTVRSLSSISDENPQKKVADILKILETNMNVSEITLGRIFISSYLRELAVDIQGVSGAEDVISKTQQLAKRKYAERYSKGIAGILSEVNEREPFGQIFSATTKDTLDKDDVIPCRANLNTR